MWSGRHRLVIINNVTTSSLLGLVIINHKIRKPKVGLYQSSYQESLDWSLLYQQCQKYRRCGGLVVRVTSTISAGPGYESRPMASPQSGLRCGRLHCEYCIVYKYISCLTIYLQINKCRIYCIHIITWSLIATTTNPIVFLRTVWQVKR